MLVYELRLHLNAGGACCRASTSGGAVHVNSRGSTLTSVTLVWVNQSQFVGNTAGVDHYLALTGDDSQAVAMDGGAWALDGGVNIFTNNTFDGNTAYGNGGALAYTYYCFTGMMPCPALPRLALPCPTLTCPALPCLDLP